MIAGPVSLKKKKDGEGVSAVESYLAPQRGMTSDVTAVLQPGVSLAQGQAPISVPVPK